MRKNVFAFIAIIEFIAIVLICVILITSNQTKNIEVTNFLSIWATVLTLVFLVFSVMGLWNIDSKIAELNTAKNDLDSKLLNLDRTTIDFEQKAESVRTKIIEEAKIGVKKIIDASATRQNLFDTISQALVEPKPDRRVLMFTNILRENPKAEGINYSYIYGCRGLAYLDMGHKEKALDDLEEALKLNPNAEAPLAQLGFYYAYIKDYQKSVEFYHKAIDKNPSKATLYLDLASSYAAMKEYDTANHYYEKGLTFEPDSAGAYYNKALTLLHSGSKDYELMEKYIDHSLLIDPLFFEAKINKASIHREINDNAGAIRILSEVIGAGISKDYIMAIEQRGIGYRMLNQIAQAELNFNYVFILDPTNVQNLCNLSAINLQMMKINEAWDFYLEGIYQAEVQDIHTCDEDFNVILDTIQKKTNFPTAINFDRNIYISSRKSSEDK